jgi:hypothetical protein
LRDCKSVLAASGIKPRKLKMIFLIPSVKAVQTAQPILVKRLRRAVKT